MVMPELKCPITNFTPAATKSLATDSPRHRSLKSSPTLALSFLPRMPPPSLMSAIACSAPCFSCAPKAALDPVIGTPIPMRTGSPGCGLATVVACAVGRTSGGVGHGGVAELHGRYHQASTAVPVAASAVPPA